jgi:hypothetical protein
MAYQFLYRTNKMNTNGVIDYLFDLFNEGKKENYKISKCNIVDLVENILPETIAMNGTGFLDELREQVGVADHEEYLSPENNLDDAIKDFFDISKHDFALDIWDVDESVIDKKTGKEINITHYEQWDF